MGKILLRDITGYMRLMVKIRRSAQKVKKKLKKDESKGKESQMEIQFLRKEVHVNFKCCVR